MRNMRAVAVKFTKAVTVSIVVDEDAVTREELQAGLRAVPGVLDVVLLDGGDDIVTTYEENAR